MRRHVGRVMRSLLTVVTLLAVASSGLPGSAVESSATSGQTPASVAQLGELYSKLHEAIGRTVEAGSPSQGLAAAPKPDEFNELLASMDEEADAELTDAVEQAGGLERAMNAADDLLEAEFPSVPKEAASKSRGETTRSSSDDASTSFAPLAQAAAAGSHEPPVGLEQERPVPEIEPPPPDFQPTSPVGPAPEPFCFGPGPGPNGGHTAVFSAGVILTVLEAIEGIFPDEQVIIPVPIPPGVPFTAPNIANIIAVILVQAATIVVAGLEFPINVYNDCGATVQWDAMRSMENTALQMYGLVALANGTLDQIHNGLIVLENQIDREHHSVDEIRQLRVQQGLTATVGAVVNIVHALPSSEGGFLDSEPVGVKKVVTDTLAAAQRSGIAVSSAAPVYLAQANAALSDGDYLEAYRMYQRAYQALGDSTTAPTTAAFASDGTAVPMVSGPSTVTVSKSRERRKVRFTFKGAKRYECSVDGRRFSRCDSPFDTPRVGRGTHTLRVRAVGGADRTPPEASRTFRVVKRR